MQHSNSCFAFPISQYNLELCYQHCDQQQSQHDTVDKSGVAVVTYFLSIEHACFESCVLQFLRHGVSVALSLECLLIRFSKSRHVDRIMTKERVIIKIDKNFRPEDVTYLRNGEQREIGVSYV